MAKKKKGKKKESQASKKQATSGGGSNKLLIIGVYILGLFLLQEIALRICFPLPELQNFNRITYQILEPNAGGPAYLRNRDMIWRSYPDTVYDFVHELNRYGYRDREWEIDKPGGKERILFVGDSFVEGMMSTGDQTIPEGFKKAAGAKAANYDIFNCGMMGIGLNEYIKFLASAVPIFKPDVVFMVMYSNDTPFQKSYQPPAPPKPQYFSFWRPRILELMDFIKKEDPIPFRWSAESIPFHKPVPDQSNPWTTKEAEWSVHVRPDLKEAMKNGQFNFFRLNWLLEEEKFLKQQTNISTQFNYLQKFLAEQNVALKVFYIPSRSQVSNHYFQFEKASCLQNCPDSMDLTTPVYHVHRNQLKHECAKRGFAFHDLTPVVQAEEAKGNHLYWNYDDHMRGKGYMLLGEAIWTDWNK